MLTTEEAKAVLKDTLSYPKNCGALLLAGVPSRKTKLTDEGLTELETVSDELLRDPKLQRYG